MSEARAATGAASTRHLLAVAKAFGVVATVGWFVFATIVVVLRYVVLPSIDDYRPAIEKIAGRAVGETVRIAAIDATWRGLRPALTMHGVTIVDAAGQEALTLSSARATLSWESLLVMDLRLDSLELDAPRLSLRRDRMGQLFVAGFAVPPKAAPGGRSAEWLLAQKAIHVRGATVVWRDELPIDGPGDTAAAGSAPTAASSTTSSATSSTDTDTTATRPDLVLRDVDLSLVRSGWRHRVALRASPPDALAAPIDLRAVIDHPFPSTRFADPAQWHGEVYADVGSGDVAAWRTWATLPTTIDGGRGRARVWLTFTAADAPAGSFAQRLAERTGRPVPPALDRIGAVIADLALDDVAVRWGAVEYAALASIDGRVVATQTAGEQRFSAAHMALQPRAGHTVPPTDFDLRHKVGATLADESGEATLGAIDIGVSAGLVPQALLPPAIAEKLATLDPRGKLGRMTVRWTGPIVAPASFEVDAAFEGLALAAQPPTAEAVRVAAREIVGPDGVARRPHPAFGQPGFANIDGTLVARRAALRRPDDTPVTTVALKVSGRNATVTAPGLFDEPVLGLADVAATIDVRVNGPDVAVAVKDASIENPDLAGTVALTLRRGPNSGGGENGGRGWIDLDARLSRADVARVPRYLPTIIGPRARAYLSKSLVSGRVASATFRMLGPLQRLDLRRMPGAAATPNPVPLAAALVAVGTAKPGAAPGPATATAPGAGSTASAATTTPASDEAVFAARIRVEGTTFRYGPARDPDVAPATTSRSGAEAKAPASTPVLPALVTPALPPLAWPAFDDVDADVVIDQARLTVFARRARFRDYRLTDVTADLPALTDPAHVLRVTGRGTGPLQDLVRFVNEGPIARWIRRATDATRADGDAALALAIDLPLTHPRDTEVLGTLRFADNAVSVDPATPSFERITGRVDFSDRGITVDGLTARALGGPLRVDAKTRDDGFIDVDVGGTVDIAALKETLRTTGAPVRAAGVVERVAARLSGSARYEASMQFRNRRAADTADRQPAMPERTTGARPDFLLTSDLAGLAIDLPAPLAKTAAEAWPLRVAVTRAAVGATASGDSREEIRVTLADRIGALVTRQANGDGPATVSTAHYSVGSAVVPGGDASSVRIVVPTLDIDAWRDVGRDLASASTAVPAALAGAATAAAPAEPPGTTAGGIADTAPIVVATAAAAAPASAAQTGADRLLPVRAHLETPLLHAGGRDFTNVTIDARRLASGWTGDVAADQIAGRLSYTDVSGAVATRNGVAPASSARLVARLTRLTVPKSETSGAHVEEALDASRQKDFPAIDLVADRFELRGRSLGRLEVLAANVGVGDDREWQLEKLGLTMPEARFTASGAWGRAAASENTRLAFDIEASDVGALMDRFGMTGTIRNGTARLTGNAAWNGGPTTIDFATMAGRMRLEADKGQFLKADPGVAKLLNILSLQGLARRLTFDFNDVFAEGFAFDTVRADAAVERGIVSTDDFTMRGVQATVSMSGTADLQHETTDLHVLVRPEINAGAASLGVAIVNPVIGLATFAAQYLFKDPISRALSFEYNVVGPWAKPEVTKIDRNGKVTPVVPKNAAARSTSPSAAE